MEFHGILEFAIISIVSACAVGIAFAIWWKGNQAPRRARTERRPGVPIDSGSSMNSASNFGGGGAGGGGDGGGD